MSVRTRAIVALVVLLIAAGVTDRLVRDAAPPRAAIRSTSAAAADDAAGSTWYCPAGIAGATGASAVIVANPTARTIRGSATVVPVTGEPARQALSVPPATRSVFHLRDLVSAPYAAVLVELDRGGAVVEHDVSGPLGFAVGPCSTAASSRWYLAQGATTRNTTLVLALYNPFPDDAIVDLSFSTDQGRSVPGDLQGVVVPPRSLVVQNIGDHVRRREQISTSVVARSGRLVVEQLELRNDPGQRGIALTLASPRTSPVWTFTEGVARDGVLERFHLYNPSNREARVDIELTLDAGVTEPLEATVPPRGRVTVVVNDVESVPKGVGHSAIVRSLDGIPVVAERSLDVSGGGRTGRTSALGGLVAARTWVLASGVANPTVDEWVVVHNPSRRPAQLSVTLLEEGERQLLDRLGGLRLAPGARRGFRINDAIERAAGSLVVASTEPVVVERAMYRIGRPGISISPGVPLD